MRALPTESMRYRRWVVGFSIVVVTVVVVVVAEAEVEVGHRTGHQIWVKANRLCRRVTKPFPLLLLFLGSSNLAVPFGLRRSYFDYVGKESGRGDDRGFLLPPELFERERVLSRGEEACPRAFRRQTRLRRRGFVGMGRRKAIGSNWDIYKLE